MDPFVFTFWWPFFFFPTIFSWIDSTRPVGHHLAFNGLQQSLKNCPCQGYARLPSTSADASADAITGFQKHHGINICTRNPNDLCFVLEGWPSKMEVSWVTQVFGISVDIPSISSIASWNPLDLLRPMPGGGTPCRGRRVREGWWERDNCHNGERQASESFLQAKMNGEMAKEVCWIWVDLFLSFFWFEL